jgi:hypothetical protein
MRQLRAAESPKGGGRMAADRKERRYCAVIQLKDGRPMWLAENIPPIMDMIKSWSRNDFEQLCRSSDGTLFAYLFKSPKPAGMLTAEFESCHGTRHVDTCIVFEVGEECSSSGGFQRPLAWIQHR